MSASSWKFITALAVALVYVAAVTALVRAERKPRSGGFIKLEGMMSYLATLPVALPLESSGHKINFRNNWQMGAAVAICGGLVFGVVLGTLHLAEFGWVSLFRRH
jgi:hypothetical protein